jgi:hypothetical protein
MILFLIRNTRPTSLGIPQLAPVSALDATPQKNPVYQFEEEEKSFCGALTRTGTPCRRLTAVLERRRKAEALYSIRRAAGTRLRAALS